MTRTKSAAGDLVIVESPAKAKTIERSCGPGRHGAVGDGLPRDLRSRLLAGISH